MHLEQARSGKNNKQTFRQISPGPFQNKTEINNPKTSTKTKYTPALAPFCWGENDRTDV